MAAELVPPCSDEDHAAALAEVGRLWSVAVGSPEGDRLDVLATLIDAYETERFPIATPPDAPARAVTRPFAPGRRGGGARRG